MIPSWLELGAVEIVNNSRTAAYMGACSLPRIRSTGCGSLADLLGDTYASPSLDPAPWYDGSEDSTRFAGFFVTSITGLDTTNVTRTVLDLVGDGGSLGTLRRQARTIVVTGWLFGENCCATSFGLRWLHKQLTADPCRGTAGCLGLDLEFLVCCPEANDTRTFDDTLRTLHGVGITDGVNILDRWGHRACNADCGGAKGLNIEFTLTASDPYAYLAAAAVTADEELTGDAGCVTWSTGDCADCGTISVATNPDCPPVTPPPSIPVVLTNCGCLPLETKRTVIPIGSGLSSVTEAALVVNFTAPDGGPIRNAQVVLLDNPTNADCADVDLCDEVASFIAAYVPAGETLSVDAEHRTITVTTATDPINAEALVTGRGGAPFVFPILRCLPACLLIDVEGELDGATVSVFVVQREG